MIGMAKVTIREMRKDYRKVFEILSQSAAATKRPTFAQLNEIMEIARKHGFADQEG